MADQLAQAIIEIKVDQSGLRKGFASVRKNLRRFMAVLNANANVSVKFDTQEVSRKASPKARATGKEIGKQTTKGVAEGIAKHGPTIYTAMADSIKSFGPPLGTTYGTAIGKSLSNGIASGIKLGSLKWKAALSAEMANAALQARILAASLTGGSYSHAPSTDAPYTPAATAAQVAAANAAGNRTRTFDPVLGVGHVGSGKPTGSNVTGAPPPGWRGGGGAAGAAGAGGGGVGRKLAAGGRQMAAAAGWGSAAVLGVQAVKTAAQFEDAMTQVQINSQATAKELQALRQEALRLASTTMFSPGETAGAMNIFVKAGYSVKQTLASTSAAIDLATASNEGLERSVANMTRQMKIWNIDSSRASDVADVLTSAMQMTGASASEVSDGLAEVGAIARQAGMDMKEAAAMFAFLRERGHSASKAAIGLSSIIQRLHRVTRPMQKELDRLVQKGMKPLDAYMQGGNIQINEFLTDLQKADPSLKALTTLFMQRGREIQKVMSGEMTLDDGTVLKGMEAINYLTENIDKNLGASSKAAALRMQNVVGVAKKLWAALQDAFVALGEALFPFLVPVMKMFTMMVSWGTDVLRTFMPLIQVLSTMAGISGSIMYLYMNGWLVALKSISLVVDGVVWLLKEAFTLLKGFSDEIGLTSILSIIWDNIKKIGSGMGNAFKSLGTAIKWVINFLVYVAKGLFSVVKYLPHIMSVRAGFWLMKKAITGVAGAVEKLAAVLDEFDKKSKKYNWLWLFAPGGSGLIPFFRGLGGSDKQSGSGRIGDLGRMDPRTNEELVGGSGFGRVGFAELGNRFQDAALGKESAQVRFLRMIEENTRPLKDREKEEGVLGFRLV